MKIINSCQAAGLLTPDLKEKEGGFIVTLFKDRFSEEQLQQLGLNERQVKAVLYVKERERITNKEYQEINNVTEQTALRDIKFLIENAVLIKTGTNKDAKYEINSVG